MIPLHVKHHPDRFSHTITSKAPNAPRTQSGTSEQLLFFFFAAGVAEGADSSGFAIITVRAVELA